MHEGSQPATELIDAPEPSAGPPATRSMGRVATDQVPTDRLPTDRLPTDRLPTGEVVLDQAVATEDPQARPTRWRGGKRLSTGHELYWWVEIIIVLVFDGIYETVRNSSKSGATRAFDNAMRVIDWQRSLGIYHEPAMQRWALHHEWLVVAANYFYGSAYIVVTISTLIYLFRRFPDDYPLWRNTLLVGTLLGLIGFATFPLMPPRLLDSLGDHRQVFGYVDTLVKYPTFWSFDSSAMKTISNQFAAMPSLHCGWALWGCAVFAPRVKHWWAKALAFAYPVVTILVVVITGNHYVLDAVGGAVIFAIGYGVARLVTRAGRRPAMSDIARS